MAGIEFHGSDAVLSQFQQLAASSEARCRKAVQAGAKVVVDRLKESVPVNTGELRDSIKASAVKYSAAEGYYCEIGPTGNDSKTGEPLAKVGNVLEYGRKYGKTTMPAKAWFHPTVAKAEGEAIQAMADAAKGDG